MWKDYSSVHILAKGTSTNFVYKPAENDGTIADNHVAMVDLTLLDAIDVDMANPELQKPLEPRAADKTAYTIASTSSSSSVDGPVPLAKDKQTHDNPSAAKLTTPEPRTTRSSVNIGKSHTGTPPTASEPNGANSRALICPWWVTGSRLLWTSRAKDGSNCVHGNFVHRKLPGLPMEALECAFFAHKGYCKFKQCKLEHYRTLHHCIASFPKS